MILKIGNIIDKDFNKIMRCIKIMNYNSNHGLYDNIQFKKYGYTHKSWVGENVCGESCFITKYILEKHNYNIKVYRNIINNNKYTNDHCFLVANDKIIIDITPKQFFLDERSNLINCQYKKYLFNLSPYLICTYNNLDEYVNNIIIANENIFGYTLFDYKNIISKWDSKQDITHKFDLYQCILNKDYLNFKPDYYKEVIKIIK